MLPFANSLLADGWPLVKVLEDFHNSHKTIAGRLDQSKAEIDAKIEATKKQFVGASVVDKIPAMGGKEEGRWKQGDWQESIVGKLLAETKWRCEVCEGKGHRYFQCPTKTWLDNYAKKIGDTANWGQWKFEKYYKDFDEATKKKDKVAARKCVATKRKRLWRNKFKVKF